MNSDGVPYRAFRKARASSEVVLSRQVFQEIREVLHRARLSRFLDPELRDDLLDQLISGAVWYEPDVTVTECRDAGDNKYLDLALAAGAAVIVSSDNDLLTLDPWRGVRILRPADYLASA